MSARWTAAALAFVFCVALSSSTEAGQQPGVVPAPSFGALRSLTTPGERLIVRDTSGRKTSGRLLSVTATELVVTRRRWNFRSERQTWTPASVLEVQHRDSTWNGDAIGAAGGVIAIVAMTKSTRCSMQCLTFATFAVPVGVLIGDVIDARMNRTLYRAPGRQVAVAPVIGAGRLGAALSYRFSP